MASPLPVPLLRLIAWSWCIVVVAYIGYGWYAYAGLYRVLAEWQIATFGAYRVFLTALLPAIALALPGLWLAGRLHYSNPAALAALADPRRGLKLVLAIGVLAVIIAAGAGVLGYRKASQVPVVASFDLREMKSLPKADQYTIIGIARPDLMLGFETETRGAKRNYVYVPLTSPQWQRGEPLTYFLKTNQNAYIPPEGGRMVYLAPHQPPFLMTLQRAVVETKALPGPVREAYRTHNIGLTGRIRVFSQDVSSAFDHYWIVAAVGGLIGIVCLLAAAITAVRLRRAGS